MQKIFFLSVLLVFPVLSTLAKNHAEAENIAYKKAARKKPVYKARQRPMCRRDTKTLCPNAQTKSYNIKGVHYRPQKHIEYQGTGIASYYGIRDKFHGKKTATGEIFNAYGLTAAHKTLPLPCYVKVTNLENNKSLILKVNDRGPFYNDRIIDVSEKAAIELGFHYDGIARVKVETLPNESIELQNNGTEIEIS